MASRSSRADFDAVVLETMSPKDLAERVLGKSPAQLAAEAKARKADADAGSVILEESVFACETGEARTSAPIAWYDQVQGVRRKTRDGAYCYPSDVVAESKSLDSVMMTSELVGAAAAAGIEADDESNLSADERTKREIDLLREMVKAYVQVTQLRFKIWLLSVTKRLHEYLDKARRARAAAEAVKDKPAVKQMDAKMADVAKRFVRIESADLGVFFYYPTSWSDIPEEFQPAWVRRSVAALNTDEPAVREAFTKREAAQRARYLAMKDDPAAAFAAHACDEFYTAEDVAQIGLLQEALDASFAWTGQKKLSTSKKDLETRKQYEDGLLEWYQKLSETARAWDEGGRDMGDQEGCKAFAHFARTRVPYFPNMKMSDLELTFKTNKAYRADLVRDSRKLYVDDYYFHAREAILANVTTMSVDELRAKCAGPTLSYVAADDVCVAVGHGQFKINWELLRDDVRANMKSSGDKDAPALEPPKALLLWWRTALARMGRNLMRDIASKASGGSGSSASASTTGGVSLFGSMAGSPLLAAPMSPWSGWWGSSSAGGSGPASGFGAAGAAGSPVESVASARVRKAERSLGGSR